MSECEKCECGDLDADDCFCDYLDEPVEDVDEPFDKLYRGSD